MNLLTGIVVFLTMLDIVTWVITGIKHLYYLKREKKDRDLYYYRINRYDFPLLAILDLTVFSMWMAILVILGGAFCLKLFNLN